ncbi:unnamed protein product [Peniophora sp. CBMAI 1063]|nr:unnamed protein product [Peniophora sp. CBMAI 1063]
MTIDPPPHQTQHPRKRGRSSHWMHQSRINGRFGPRLTTPLDTDTSESSVTSSSTSTWPSPTKLSSGALLSTPARTAITPNRSVSSPSLTALHDSDARQRPLKEFFENLLSRPSTPSKASVSTKPQRLTSLTSLLPSASSQSHTRPVMSLTIISFTGQNGDDPVDFKRRFRQWCISIATSDDAGMANAFSTCIKSGSVADHWFATLSSAEKSSYTAIEAAFDARFPPVEAAILSSDDIQQELHDLKLDLKDVGKKVKVGSTEVWAHVDYVMKAKQLATEAKILTTNNNLLSIRRQLPEPLLDLLDFSKHMTLEAFFSDIKSVNTQRLADKATAARAQAAEIEALHASIAALSLSNSRRSSQDSRGATVPPAAAAVGSPYVTRGNAANQAPGFRRQMSALPERQPRAPPPAPTVEQRRRLETFAAAPVPHYTPASCAAYEVALASATAPLGHPGRVTYDTPIPLKPGTAAPCSRECYKCGTHGHRGMFCTVPNGAPTRLNGYESRWRALLGTTLGPVNAGRVNDVRLVQDAWDSHWDGQAQVQDVEEKDGGSA